MNVHKKRASLLVFVFAIVLCLIIGASASQASQKCPIGYQPKISVVAMTREDLERMSLPLAEFKRAEQKISDLHEQGEALLAEYDVLSDKLEALLTSPEPDRSVANELALDIVRVVSDLSELRVTKAVDLKDIVGRKNARGVRHVVPFRSFQCSELSVIPEASDRLVGREKTVIGLTEQEQKYLNDFDRRELNFQKEQRDIRWQLDRALKQRTIDHLKVRDLLKRLELSLRQDASNRLDRFFYYEAVLLSPEREFALSEYRSRRKSSRKTKVKASSKSVKAKKAKKSGKKWYWPF